LQILETIILQSFAGFDSTARSLFDAHIRAPMAARATSARFASSSATVSPSALQLPFASKKREVGASIQVCVIPTAPAVRAAATAHIVASGATIESAIASGSAPECRGFMSANGGGTSTEMARPWQADTPALLLDDDDDDLD
jgi:hypothetical protein